MPTDSNQNMVFFNKALTMIISYKVIFYTEIQFRRFDLVNNKCLFLLIANIYIYMTLKNKVA